MKYQQLQPEQNKAEEPNKVKDEFVAPAPMKDNHVKSGPVARKDTGVREDKTGPVSREDLVARDDLVAREDVSKPPDSYSRYMHQDYMSHLQGGQLR